MQVFQRQQHQAGSHTHTHTRTEEPVPCVLLQVAELPEGLLAVSAGVGLGTAVDADVLGQVAGVGK